MEDIDYVNHCLPDYIGFVFAKSKRQVTLAQALKMKQQLKNQIKAVGVFVDEKQDVIVETVNRGAIDMVQLHGHENQDYIHELRLKINVPIIKAIKVIDETSIQQYDDVDYYLFDGSKAGSGQCFSWSLIQRLDKPIFLAGGLSIDNIDLAMKQPVEALDISSGVETNGDKDIQKIKEIVRRVRNER